MKIKINKSRINRQLKLYPTISQQENINQHLWRLISVYNWCLKSLDEYDNNRGQGDFLTGTPAKYYLINQLSGISKKIELSKRSIEGVIDRVVKSKTKYINDLLDPKIKPNKKAGKPRYKSQKNRLNYIYFLGDCRFSKDRQHIIIPLIGHIKFRGSVPTGKLKTAQINKKASGYYITLCFEGTPNNIPLKGNNIVAIDPGFKNALNLAIFNEELNTLSFQTIENPRFYEKRQEIIAKKQRSGSKKKAARAHEKLANQRHDWQHKVTRHIASIAKQVFWSDDNFNAMKKLFGKSINSLGPAALRVMLETKSRKFNLVNNYKSTQTCTLCMSEGGPRGLKECSVRYWSCESCGAYHARDENSGAFTMISGLGETSEDAARYVWNLYDQYVKGHELYKTIVGEGAVGNSSLVKAH